MKYYCEVCQKERYLTVEYEKDQKGRRKRINSGCYNNIKKVRKSSDPNDLTIGDIKSMYKSLPKKAERKDSIEFDDFTNWNWQNVGE